MKIVNTYLSESDKKLLEFLAKYKIIKTMDAIKFYKNCYGRKRLDKLKQNNYIYKYKWYYIKLTQASKRLLEKEGIECSVPIRDAKSLNRTALISDLGMFFYNSIIDFNPSWMLKGTTYTDYSKKYLGEIIFKNKKHLTYFIKKENKNLKIIYADIRNDFSYNYALIITDDLKVIGKKYDFLFNNKISCLFILNNKLDLLFRYNNFDKERYLNKIYNSKLEESTYSGYDYQIGNKCIVFMPILDTYLINNINIFYMDCDEEKIDDFRFEIVTHIKNVDITKGLLSEKMKDKCTFKIIDELDKEIDWREFSSELPMEDEKEDEWWE